MQTLDARPPVRPGVADGVVLALRATDGDRLRAALHRIAAEPDLLDRLRRVVVVDAGATASAAALRLPAGLLRVVRRPAASAPEALSLRLLAALDETASDVLVLDDAALADPAALLAATVRRSPATAVVGLRDAAAAGSGPLSWWGVLLPLDAIRAVGAALPEAGGAALADLVLRAEAAGFRSAVIDAPGPVPAVREVDRVLLALLHGGADAAPVVLRTGIAGDLRLLHRPGDLLGRRADLRDLLAAAGEARTSLPRLRTALAWRTLQRRVRAGALERASEAAWVERLGDDAVDRGWPRAEREAADGRPAAVRLPAWSTTRGTSAA
ncbi:hypothetical protein [Amnibacterium kyonggiense]